MREIQVKSAAATSHWIWGAFKMPGATLHALHRLWMERERRDEYIGTLVNAWLLTRQRVAWGVQAGESYVDVGTLNGYREAMRLLGGHAADPTSLGAVCRGPGRKGSGRRDRRRGLDDRSASRSGHRTLGPWFHNMELRGVRTAPEHFLGDYPRVKWEQVPA